MVKCSQGAGRGIESSEEILCSGKLGLNGAPEAMQRENPSWHKCNCSASESHQHCISNKLASLSKLMNLDSSHS